MAAGFSAVLVLLARPAAAQEVETTEQAADTTAADTTAAMADTTAAAADTTAAAFGATLLRSDRPPVGFGRIWSGRAVSDSVPVLLPALDLVDLIAREPATFTYLFGTPGWPDGWSFRGLPPQSSMLTFNDLPFSHLFTGAAAHDLIPLSLVEPPDLQPGSFGHPSAVFTGMRPFDGPTPMTEAKYWKGGDGLQSIEAVHAQHRLRPLFGNPGFLNILGSYTGRAADGEYPGSRLRRARQVVLRLRYEQRDWSLEVFNLHNRRSVGAHGGVVADPGNFESIYIRPGASVATPEARRRIVRNDLAATLRLRLLPEASTVALYWTAETFRFTRPADTLGATSDRVGVLFSQPLTRTARHAFAVNVAAWSDWISPRHQFSQPTLSSGVLHASVRDTLRAAGWRTTLEGGIAAFGGGVRPVGTASISRQAGAFTFEAGASVSDRPAPVVSRSGFGSLLGAPEAEPGRVLLGTVALRFQSGGLDVELGGFAHRRSAPTDYFSVADDSAAVMTSSEPLDGFGAYLDVGWRRDAVRGLYAALQPSLFRFSGGGALNERIADALPALTGRGRAGARFVLFEGDLDVDAYAEAVAWSSMRSRLLHPETGLLTVPEGAARVVGPSTMVNVIVEAGVREATLFLVYENVLSGTALMTGNLIVPVYPLPERRFRFGVFWPIFG